MKTSLFSKFILLLLIIAFNSCKVKEQGCMNRPSPELQNSIQTFIEAHKELSIDKGICLDSLSTFLDLNKYLRIPIADSNLTFAARVGIQDEHKKVKMIIYEFVPDSVYISTAYSKSDLPTVWEFFIMKKDVKFEKAASMIHGWNQKYISVLFLEGDIKSEDWANKFLDIYSKLCR